MKLIFANKTFLATKNNFLNQTYSPTNYYGRNQNFFYEAGTQNIFKGIEQTQHFNPNFYPLLKISKPVLDEPKSSSRKHIIVKKAEIFFDTDHVIAKNIPVSFSMNPLTKNNYENDSEKKMNNFLQIIPNTNTNEIKAKEWRRNLIDFLTLELSSSVPLKNLARFKRQSQQQNVTTLTTTVATTVATTRPTFATTAATTTTSSTTTTSPTTTRLNSCFTQTCDQTITGRRLSYARC